GWPGWRWRGGACATCSGQARPAASSQRCCAACADSTPARPATPSTALARGRMRALCGPVRAGRLVRALLRGLRGLHTGQAGDYVTWLVAGTFLLGLTWAVTLTSWHPRHAPCACRQACPPPVIQRLRRLSAALQDRLQTPARRTRVPEPNVR